MSKVQTMGLFEQQEYLLVQSQLEKDRLQMAIQIKEDLLKQAMREDSE
jgi:hypothetical protein